jgi:hypothetical protein
MIYSFYEVFVKVILPILFIVVLSFVCGYLFAKAF